MKTTYYDKSNFVLDRHKNLYKKLISFQEIWKGPLLFPERGIDKFCFRHICFWGLPSKDKYAL